MSWLIDVKPFYKWEINKRIKADELNYRAQKYSSNIEQIYSLQYSDSFVREYKNIQSNKEQYFWSNWRQQNGALPEIPFLLFYDEAMINKKINIPIMF